MTRLRSNDPQPRFRALPAAITAAALLTLTACGGGSTDSSSPRAKTLSLAIQSAPNSFDPTQLNDGQAAYIWSSLYDTLLYTDNKGELKPNAAESWKYSADGLTLTLKLRQGMKFSSGAAVNAAAVKATLERTMTTPGSQQGLLAAVKSVDAPDASTVVIHLKQRDGSLLTSFSTAAGVIGDPATLSAKSTALDPVGSGPYVLDKSSVTGSTYVLKRRDGYWNVKAYPFQTVTVKVIQDPTAAANALQAGQINAGPASPENSTKLKAMGYKISPLRATAVADLVLADRAGSVLKPLGDPRVRQAINMAFDRTKIAKQLLKGAAQPTVQVFNPAGGAYDAALEKTYPFDPAAAKKLLAKAGYPKGFSVTMPGFLFTKAFEPTVTQALDDIGIKVKWTPVPAQNTISAITSKKYPMILFIDGLNTSAREAGNNYTPTGYLNPFNSTDPALTKLLAQANGELDAAKAADAYKKVNEFAVKNAWNSPIAYLGNSWATKGVVYLGDGSNTFSTIRAFGVSG
ncbi:peptide/nickel transport system substrate-binding protein [Streptomyces sp. yr375]|uniref:ABC transporter substrate-binding protein n=1 Tax=Streptomyces sp. yr375 TaxID=1761906 RepID=UPI0008CE6710|nr:ABC transporter substrate-binding protein [Streptomyces sp. yr375]SES33749.1 peptide/nickel transport system substrate-binding protein [Streptomyces sp. yr375]